ISPEVQKEWMDTFGLKSIEDTYMPNIPKSINKIIGKDVSLTKGSLIKMAKHNRLSHINKIKPTLETPDFIIKQDQSNYIFAKDFNGEKFFTSVAGDRNGKWVIVSNAPKSLRGLNNKLNNGGRLIYGKLPSTSD
ncbi:PBECR2 nuclease fold domain-containing protein, partial [Helicobacter sp. 11S02629-2]|uniref:PBECR2 nuclease fold domain-containing protein n=1 Tax=Helicobacter sp. 11S02629-2 TaxID=1476195 RepID=UPI002150C273